jgi:hypothetical protein
MGRVTSVDVISVRFAEGVSTYSAGYLQDAVHLDEHKTSLVFSMIAACVFVVWSLYHFMGKGVACCWTDTAVSR